MKPKEIYKITFSGLYATATLKAEIEPHPHLVKLDQVGKDISNFSGYWYFHVWVEAKSKKTAIRKGAVQIMDWLGTEGRKVISAVTLGTMEALLEQKAVWEVLRAKEEEDAVPPVSETEEDTAKEDKLNETDNIIPEHTKDEASQTEYHEPEDTKGYIVALKHKGMMDEGSPSPTPFIVGDYESEDWALVQCKPCQFIPANIQQQVKFNPKNAVIEVYITKKEYDSLVQIDLLSKRDSKLRRLALAKLKFRLFEAVNKMGEGLGTIGDYPSYDPFKFKVRDKVRVVRTGAQYTTYYRQLGLMFAEAYENLAYDAKLTQGDYLTEKMANDKESFEVMARETIWEPMIERFTNVYLIKNCLENTYHMIAEYGLELL